MTRHETTSTFRLALLGLAGAVALGACQFTDVTGVGTLPGFAAPGLLAVAEDGEYVYAGTRETDDFEATTTLHALDPLSGTILGATPPLSGAFAIRDVEADDASDGVLTLHANGALIRWSDDLSSPLAIYTDAFDFTTADPNVDAVEYCGLRMARYPGGLFAHGLVHIDQAWYRCSDYSSPGGSSSSSLQYAFSDAELGNRPVRAYCPRWIHNPHPQTETSEVLFLSPMPPGAATPSRLYRDQIEPTGVGFIDAIDLPPLATGSERSYVDVAVDHAGAVVAISDGDGGDGVLLLYDLAPVATPGSMTLADSVSLDHVRAVYLPRTESLFDAYEAHVWFSGHDEVSGDDIGVVNMID